MRLGQALASQERSESFAFGGLDYQLIQTLASATDPVDRPMAYGDLAYVYRTNAVIFACCQVRSLLFSEVRFQWRQRVNGRPGRYFGNTDLLPLEVPHQGGTTGDLLTQAIQDVDLAGNFYAVRQGAGLHRLRPDWVSIVVTAPEGDPNAPDAEIAGYIFHQGGVASASEPVTFLPEQVVHWAPAKDPAFRHRGISWLTPCLAEIAADQGFTEFKSRFMANGATPNMVVTLDPSVGREAFDKWTSKFKADHEGLANAHKPLMLGGGASAQVVGVDLKALDLKSVQGAGETRIAAAAGVPPNIVGLSEGIASTNYATYTESRRRFADGTMRPLWRSFTDALSNVLVVPRGAELAYDDRDVPFLRDDVEVAAQVQSVNASAIKSLIDAGYSPESVVTAVTTGDLAQLTHSGLVSVQLLPPGSANGGSKTPAFAGSNQ
jgi:HK97 family phage portal protein